MNAELARMLIESDRAYFAAGAECLEFDGGRLRWMPGLQHLAAGCIVEPDGSVAADRFPDAAREAVGAVGAPLLRLYLPQGHGGDAEWIQQGFAPAVELAYARRPQPLPGLDPAVAICRLVTPADWAAKETLAAAMDNLPDGKPASAADWTLLERRKSEAGYARFYLAEIDGQPCGTFGLADCRPLLRLKNLAVHPGFRRQGISRAILHFARQLAFDESFEWLGAFALEGGAGSRLYASDGFELVGAQTEWTMPVAARAAPAAAAQGAAAC